MYIILHLCFLVITIGIKFVCLSSTLAILLASWAIYSCIPPQGHPILYNYCHVQGSSTYNVFLDIKR